MGEEHKSSHPLQFLLLLLGAVLLPLLLHKLQELLSTNQEAAALLVLPGLDLDLQLLFQLQSPSGQTCWCVFSRLTVFFGLPSADSSAAHIAVSPPSAGFLLCW